MHTSRCFGMAVLAVTLFAAMPLFAQDMRPQPGDVPAPAPPFSPYAGRGIECRWVA